MRAGARSLTNDLALTPTRVKAVCALSSQVWYCRFSTSSSTKMYPLDKSINTNTSCSKAVSSAAAQISIAVWLCPSVDCCCCWYCRILSLTSTSSLCRALLRNPYLHWQLQQIEKLGHRLHPDATLDAKGVNCS